MKNVKHENTVHNLNNNYNGFINSGNIFPNYLSVQCMFESISGELTLKEMYFFFFFSSINANFRLHKDVRISFPHKQINK